MKITQIILVSFFMIVSTVYAESFQDYLKKQNSMHNQFKQMKKGKITKKHVIMPEPIAKYMFDGNANDSSKHMNHGIVNGPDLSEDRAGNVSRAYLFYKNRHNLKISKTDENNFGSGSFAVSFWIKIADKAKNFNIMTNKVNSTKYWRFEYQETGNIVFQVVNQEGDHTYINRKIGTGKWHHITGVRDSASNTMSLYINSNLAGTTSCVAGNAGNGDIVIGEKRNRLVLCRIDDVYLWNTDLKPVHVKKHYSGLLNVTCSQPFQDETIHKPVGIYMFDGNANDKSEQKNDAIVDNADLTVDRFGNSDRSYAFVGSGVKIKIPLIPANTFSKGSFSISFWVKIKDKDQNCKLLSNYGGENHQWVFEYNNTGSIVFYVQNKEKEFSVVRAAKITVNKWLKVTGIRNAARNTISLFVTDNPSMSKSGVKGDLGEREIYIGDITGRGIKACIDEVTLWKRPLTLTEVSNIKKIDFKHKYPTGNIKKIKNKVKLRPRY